MADTNQILKLAAIIREVDGDHSKGAAALAESILDHPGFRVVLASWGTSNLTQTKLSPAAGEVVGLVKMLKGIAYWKLHGKPGDKPTPFDIRQAARLTRAAELLQRQVMVPVAVSDALIKAECALSDIAEGEPMADEGDPLKWAERRCADTLAIIRPTMMQHKIRTSEWPPVVATAKPLPEVDQMTWQPIDTAPRDGTEILASDYDAIEIVSWVGPRLDVRITGEWTNREGEAMYPAWWQPLPDHLPLPEVGE